MLTLILGGARSGKSRLAQKLAAVFGRVTYIATAERDQDAEMAARIERHRAIRPGCWRTIEEPVALACAAERAARESDAILIDCLTIWLSNLSWKYRDDAQQALEDCVRGELGRVATTARSIHVILVSNEVGSGIVPEAAVARAFRDTQGFLNQWAAELADEVILTVAGLPLYLKKAAQSEGAE